MSNNKQKLELSWIGKNNQEYDIANIEPRILEEKPELSYGDHNTENMIIHGDNLLALKALLPEFEGKVTCVSIDPPYNTGARDWKYNNNYVDGNDSFRHSKWLSFMEKRLQLSKRLLKSDGVLLVTIDEKELTTRAELLEVLKNKNNLNVVLTVGAGDIDTLIEPIKHELNKI